MEKAIEIKRRAQRCIQNGDLDGALTEYEKLVGAEDSDPYNYVLLADLLYKKGDQNGAFERYLSAVSAYERASLFKNAIAVCKKMMRLSLSPARVLQALANLHAQDGLASEAALYFVQYAEHMVRSNAPAEAAKALRQAFDVSQENLRVLEQLSEAWLLAGENALAAQTLTEAAEHYRHRGAEIEARRCLERAAMLDSRAATVDPETGEAPPKFEPMHTPEPGAVELSHAPEPGTSAQPALAVPGIEVPLPDAGIERFGRAMPLGEPEPVDAGAAGDAPMEVISTGSVPQDDITTSALAGADAPAPMGSTLAGLERSHFDAPAPSVADGPEKDEADIVVYDIDESEIAPATPAEVPAVAPQLADVTPATPAMAFEGQGEPEPIESPLAQVEELLAAAQREFRAGDRDTATQTLTHAAQAYEELGRLENAATIYRSLGRGAHATPEILQLWLDNCEKRGEAGEAAQVACDLGDRALTDGNEPAAREWFERATVLDVSNETARRRLQRLSPAPEPGADVVAVAAPADVPAPRAEESNGRVEVAVGRAEAISFDLEGLLEEFQRGVETQLAGDPQSHYDLAMTYREMGLFDQAMSSFRVAAADSGFAARAHEMIGRCLADQGRYAEAAAEMRRALAMPGMGEDNDVELRYHLGCALAELGEHEDALCQYEVVAGRMAGFADVDGRIAALRRVLGQS